jgi:hypothetical protein
MHFNVTKHPTSAWTLQQLRKAVGYEDSYRRGQRDLCAGDWNDPARMFGLVDRAV